MVDIDFDNLGTASPKEVKATKKVEDYIPIRKPKKHEFFRIRNDSAWEIEQFPLYTRGGSSDESETVYLVQDERCRSFLNDNGMLEYSHFYAAISRSTDVFFLTYIPNPTKFDSAGNPVGWNKYHESRNKIYGRAKVSWIRMTSNLAEGVYEAHIPEEKLEEPIWPEFPHSMKEAMNIAFKDYIIDSFDHPEMRHLRGMK